jgi:hypothetical protein
LIRDVVLLTNLACTLFLTGVAWVLQVVQLPLFSKTAPPGFVEGHRRRNTILMAVPMFVELVTSVWLWQVAALALVLVIWIVTFVWYIPAYSRLARGNAGAIRQLTGWHWVRTLCWTGRSAIMLWITAGRLRV